MDTTSNAFSPDMLPSSTSSPFLVVGSATTTVASAPNRSRSSQRVHRSRRGFASRKSKLTLSIDDEPAAPTGDAFTTRQSTPASTSSSCSSDVNWWEVEYKCPPPGHLGAHVVPVSADEQLNRVASVFGESTAPSFLPTDTDMNSTVTQAETPTESSKTMDLIESPSQKSDAIRPGATVFETPERVHRPYNKLKALATTPCLLVDSSPSQKRKMRSMDPTDTGTELFSTPVAKRFHSSLKARLEITPSTLVQPLTEIGISKLRTDNKPPAP